LRASPRDRDDVRYCLLQGKKERDKGMVIGKSEGTNSTCDRVLRRNP
jgi:outer membrane lipoprotein SlyB